MQFSLLKDENPLSLPFGRHKDRPIEVIRHDDPEYLNWLIGQEWFRKKFPTHYTIIISQGASTDQTPAHNAMQALFLEDELCFKAIAVSLPAFFAPLECSTIEEADAGTPEEKRSWALDESKRAHLIPASARTWRWDNERVRRVHATSASRLQGASIERLPERAGWDWIIRARFKCAVCANDVFSLRMPQYPYLREESVSMWPLTVGLELKPTLGDDYPSVLRQVQQHGSLNQFATSHVRTVVVGHYTGEGASFDQAKKIFAAAHVNLVLLQDIQECAVI